MNSNESMGFLTPAEIATKVNGLFLREDQPLIAQQEQRNRCLSLIYDGLMTLRSCDGWRNLEVSVSAQRLREAGFISAEQEDHLTEADKVSLMVSFEPNEALMLEERYFRTDPAVSGGVSLNLHRDMVKKFTIKKADGDSFEIILNSFFSPQTRLAVFPTRKVLPQAYQEISGTQFGTDKKIEYPTSKITPKDINRLLFILFSGLFSGPLHPPSSLVQNGN